MAWADRSDLEHAALRYCAPRGIPLSVFLGRIIYPGDPQWDDDDRDAVFDWMIEEARYCPGCGADRTKALNPDNTFEYEAEVLWCHGCRANHRADVRLAGQGAKENPLAGGIHRFTHTPGDADGDIADAS